MRNRVLLILILLSFFYCSFAVALSFDNKLIDAVDQNNEYLAMNLMRNKANINAKGKFGATALSRAVINGNVFLVRELLKAGANPNIQDVGGATPLHFAASNGQTDILKLLIAKGGNANVVDNFSITPIMRALDKRQYNTVGFLIGKSNLNYQNKYGQSARDMIERTGNQALQAILAKYSVINNHMDRPKIEVNYRESIVRGDQIKNLQEYRINPKKSMVTDELMDYDDAGEDAAIDEIINDPPSSSTKKIIIGKAIRLPKEYDIYKNSQTVRDLRYVNKK